jgi:hypothetical protein
MCVLFLKRGATAPHRTAPHRTAPHRTAPHRTALHHTLLHFPNILLLLLLHYYIIFRTEQGTVCGFVRKSANTPLDVASKTVSK